MGLSAWLGALAIGLALGLLGSGGSILTVPVLAYLVGQEEKTAIAGSLFVVGAVASGGALQYAWRRTVDWRSVLLFGLPGMAGTYAGAWLGGRVSGTLQITVFAGVMVSAAALMAKPPALAEGREPRSRAAWKVVVDGLAVGVLTGFVGVGGGFLIVPALVILGGLPIHLAIGTSLTIIALKSFTGFAKYLEVLDARGLEIDWPVLLTISAIGVLGSVVGRKIGKRVPQEQLRRLFAVFLVIIAFWILSRSLPELF